MHCRFNRFRLTAWIPAVGILLVVRLAGAAEVCDSTSVALFATGDVPGALARCEQGLAVAQATLPPEHPDVARYRHGIGVLAYALGDDERARTELEAALLLYERANGPEYGPIADVLGTLGSIALETGDVPTALAAQRRSVAISEKEDSSGIATASALDRLGDALAASGEFQVAEGSHRRALEIFERAGGDSARLVSCLQHLAGDARALGNPERARVYFLRARAILLAVYGPGHPALDVSIAGLATLAAADGDLDRARAHDREAAAILRRALGPEHPLLAEALAVYAGSLIRTGHNQDAVDAAIEAETIRSDHLRFVARSLPEGEALRYAGRLASGLGVAVAASIRTWDSTMVERVWDTAVRSRALVLDEIAARHRWADLRVDSATVALVSEGSRTRRCLARLSLRGTTGMEPDVYRATLERLKSASEETERALRSRNPSLRLEHARAGAGLSEVRSALPHGTGLVSLWRYLDPTLRPRRGSTGPRDPAGPAAWSYTAFVIAGTSGTARVIPLGDAEELDSLVSAWRRSIVSPPSAGGGGAAQDERTLGRILRKRLWDPIAPHLQGATRVVLVPDGSFHLVNPAALRLDDDRFLVDIGPTFQIVSSERDLIGPARASAPGAGLLAMGDPDFDAPHRAMSSLDRRPDREDTPQSDDDVYRGASPCASGAMPSHWAPLPGSAREVEAIAELWERTNGGEPVVLRGEAATEGAFQKLAPGRKALHLATHGFFSGSCAPGENPLARSGPALAGANSGPADSVDGAPRTEDGILTADEISAMDLGSVECAVLSGCETGVGVVRAGEGVLGLRRAFEVAGVRNLVMTLWPVTDRAAREWSVKFYEARLVKGLDASSAAREATRSVLEERRAAGTDDPFVWAAFLASGR
jgi:CHAT domain-containing protein/tetratricopeptide (TPR) repeat protein